MTKEERVVHKHHRKISNFLIAPKSQLRIAMITTGVGLFFFFALFGYQIRICSTLLTSLAASVPENAAVILECVHSMWLVFIALSLAFTAVLMAVTIVISHRVYGPAYAIRKHLTAMTQGDYSYRTHLRKGDDFKDLARDLNQVSEQLESKQERPL